MLLIRMTFWLGLVVLVMPTDANDQARLHATASATVERATTFCERNPNTCAAGGELWATFTKKAEFAARLGMDLISSRGARNEETAPTGRATPASARPAQDAKPHSAGRGTLTPADLNPAWRGQQVSRAGN